MHLILLLVGFVVFVLVAIGLVLKQRASVIPASTLESLKTPEPVEEKKKDRVYAKVTYTDGTMETFVSGDGEVELNSDGTVAIRADAQHCVTINPRFYRKIEETHE